MNRLIYTSVLFSAVLFTPLTSVSTSTTTLATKAVTAPASTVVTNAISSSTPTIDEAKILKNSPGLNQSALHAAVNAYKWALKAGHVSNASILTVIDFNLPSSKKRAWVIDLKKNKTVMNFHTTHGKNSGAAYATKFSNKVNSDTSSVGVFVTLNAYVGKHGLSERIKGLEPGVNDNAYKRNIVVHPANYATASYIKAKGQAGRSWGCFAISPALSKEFVKLTQNGSVIFAFAKQTKWA